MIKYAVDISAAVYTAVLVEMFELVKLKLCIYSRSHNLVLNSVVLLWMRRAADRKSVV